MMSNAKPLAAKATTLGAVACLALAGTARSADAAVINAAFSGTVSSQASTAYALGSAISGSFSYDTSLERYTGFNIGTYSLPAGATSNVPPPLSATQSVQFSAIAASSSTGGTTNTALTVDLETNGFFNTTNLLSFVQNPGPGAITTNPLDPNPSFFEYASGSSGSPSAFVIADLSSFAATVTGVPEPASLALLAAALSGLAVTRCRRA